MSDQLFTEAATYTTNTRHPCDPRDSNPHPSNQAAADLTTSYTARPPGSALETMCCSVIEILMQMLSGGDFHIFCQPPVVTTHSHLSVTSFHCQGFKNRLRRLRVLEVPLTLLAVLRYCPSSGVSTSTLYTQQEVFVMLVLLASASVVRMELLLLVQC